MHADARPLTDAQRRKLCEMMHLALVELRLLGWDGKATQAADLADAFHNLPTDLWRDDFSLSFFRDAYLEVYQLKHSRKRGWDYVTMVNEVIAMTD